MTARNSTFSRRVRNPASVVAPTEISADETLPDFVGRPLADLEREVILATLRAVAGNRTRAAAVLDISPRSLRGKLAEFAAAGHAVPAPSAGQRG